MAELFRSENESVLEHHKRLVYGKLVDKTLAENDYAELAPYVYGKAYSSDITRRMMYGSKRTLDLLESQAGYQTVADQSILNELEAKRLEIKKERQKLFDQRSAYNKIVREQARAEELKEIISKAIQNSNLPSLIDGDSNLCSQNQCRTTQDNDVLVSLNDIHYGAWVDNHWRVYNSDICRDMMYHYLYKVIEIGKRHNSENCIVWANGDAISGNIHHSIAVTNKENVIEQVVGVSELIAEFLAELSKHFNQVKFVSVAGNHSRIDTKEKALKDERLDDLVDWYLQARLQNFENIEVGAGNKIDTTMYLIDIRGKTYCGVHGDYDGSDSKIQALQTMAQQPLYAVLFGHLHRCKIDTVQGIKIIMAGSFLGMDDYCVGRRIFGQPEQMVCICDSTGVVCSYCIDLQDNKAS